MGVKNRVNDIVIFKVQLNLSITTTLKTTTIGFQAQLSLNAAQQYCH